MYGHLEITLINPLGIRRVQRIENNAPHKILKFLLGRKPITIENIAFDLSMVNTNGATVTGNKSDCRNSDIWIVHQDDASREIQEHRFRAWREIEDGESLDLRPDRLPTWGFIASQWLHRRPVYTKIVVRQRP